MKCEVCNSEDRVCFNKITQKYLCGRHRQQVSKNGKVLLYTCYDKNNIITYNDCAEIVLLDKNYVEIARAKISLNRIEKVKLYSWRLQDYNNPKDSYVVAKHNKQAILLHRYLLDAKENEVVDHINRDKLNNLDENLRKVCTSENQVNKGIMSNNTSGVTGVTWDRLRDKWKVSLNIYNKCYNLGRYDNFDDAVRVRLDAEKLYHKEFIPIERQEHT
jgi:hypothetical protein